jgi:hypothetical protein
MTDNTEVMFVPIIPVANALVQRSLTNRNATAEGRARNRRVEIILTGDLLP